MLCAVFQVRLLLLCGSCHHLRQRLQHQLQHQQQQLQLPLPHLSSKPAMRPKDTGTVTLVTTARLAMATPRASTTASRPVKSLVAVSKPGAGAGAGARFVLLHLHLYRLSWLWIWLHLSPWSHRQWLLLLQWLRLQWLRLRWRLLLLLMLFLRLHWMH